MKPFNTLTIALLSLSLFIGCSTTESPREPSIVELQRQREAATDRAVFEESLRKSYEASAASLKVERDNLRAEVATLKQAKDAGGAPDQTTSRLVNFLRINDYLLENKGTVVKHFNSEWSPKRESLFSAAGGKGQLLDFEVDDVFFYKGYVVVSSLFLWRNQDASGGVGRSALSLDPDKDFEAIGCEMTAQNRLSRQELASLLDNGTGQTSSQRLEQAAAQVPAQTAQQGKPFFDERTKEKLKDAAIGLTTTALGAWIIHAIQSSQ